MTHYISYKEFPDIIGLKQGDRIYLSSDIMALAFIAKKNGESFSIDALINVLQEHITLTGTIMIPTFHFDFSNKGVYDYCQTPSSTGALGNAALKRADFRRTMHPMHSFAVWGKDQELLCGMQNLNSFGKDSPFGYMHENNVIQIMLGTDYQRSMTFVHYVENMAKVPYRFYKEFTGEYVDERGERSNRTYEYPARYLELGSVERFNRVGEILEEQKIVKEFVLNDIPIKKVPLGESYPIIYHDAKYNMCRNLYDFEKERELIWNQN